MNSNSPRAIHFLRPMEMVNIREIRVAIKMGTRWRHAKSGRCGGQTDRTEGRQTGTLAGSPSRPMDKSRGPGVAKKIGNINFFGGGGAPEIRKSDSKKFPNYSSIP